METIVCPECIAEGVVRYRPPDPNATRSRCATHWRAIKKARKKASHDKRVVGVYGLLPGEYDLLYAAQGGKCAIRTCRAQGLGRRLAVEHDHTLEHLGWESVRGLMCAVHNEWIGRAGDDPEVFIAIAEYLRNPPARGILARARQQE